MIQRFNFYDIYGYFLPGTLLLVLMWLPFGLLLGEWPRADLTSAVVAGAFAYIAGHILHTISEAAFPLKLSDQQGHLRYPSDLLVDANRERVLPKKYIMPPETMRQLTRQIKNAFGIDITDPKTRSIAFFQCRNLLIQDKAAAYAEQQEGMYALMRGVTAALVFACALYIGLALSECFKIPASCTYRGVIITIMLAGLMSFLARTVEDNDHNLRQTAYWALVLTVFLCGLLAPKLANPTTTSAARSPTNVETNLVTLARSLNSETNAVQFQVNQRAVSELNRAHELEARAPWIMFAMGMVAALFAAISHSAFRDFTLNFAATVYRDFNSLVPRPPPSHREIAAYAYELFVMDDSRPGREVDHWLRAEAELNAQCKGRRPCVKSEESTG